MTDKKITIAISTMAQVLGIHQRTLRIWDKEGILVPRRTEKNRRCYSMEDIKRGELILYLTGSLLVNLSAVKIILGLLKRSEVGVEESICYINEIAHVVNINEEVQEQNLKKNARRGRKRKD